MRENTCLSPKKKNPLPNSGIRDLSLLLNYVCWGVVLLFFLIKLKRGQHQNLFLIKDRLHYFQRDCICYRKSKPLLYSKAVNQKQLGEVERSSDQSRKGTKKPPVWIGGFFVRSGASVSLFPLRRISTPHKYIFANLMKKANMRRLVYWLSHFAKVVIKKHPDRKKQGAFFNRTIVWGVVLLLSFYSNEDFLSLQKNKMT